jgi:phi LC3 family holin
MKINWKVRLKNPVFWANLAAAIVLPVLTYMGLNWSDMTTWGAFFSTMGRAFGNPVLVVSVVVSVWNLLYDPTTAGLCDSKQAMTYQEPKKDTAK